MATLRGRVLLGWMERDDAVKFLLNDCVFDPPIDAQEAERVWRGYRNTAESIPIRLPTMPTRLPLTNDERIHKRQFMRFMQTKPAHGVLDVIKTEMKDWAVIQYCIVTERADKYNGSVQADKVWLRECMPLTDPRASQIRVKYSQNGMNTAMDIDLEHAEHFFTPDQGKFSVAQALRHVTVMESGNRMYLTAGYHRSFARFNTAPTATVPTAVVALAVNTLVSNAPPIAAPGLTIGLHPFGSRAAVLADFFTDGLFMDVALRKKRYQLQVRSTFVAIDDTGP